MHTYIYTQACLLPLIARQKEQPIICIVRIRYIIWYIIASGRKARRRKARAALETHDCNACAATHTPRYGIL